MSIRKSLTWTYASNATSFVVTFASTIIVARLVTPKDFGVMAMAAAVSIVLNVFMQLNPAKYIIREAEICSAKLRAAFTVNVLISLVYSASLVIAGMVSKYILASSEVGEFLIVTAIFPLLAMMEFTPSTLCARSMRFGIVSSLTLVRSIVVAVTTVIFAWLGFAYMSFAWAQIVAWVVTSITFNVIVWCPEAYRLQLKGVREIVHFGSKIIGVHAVAQLNTRVGEMTLGSMLGLGALGLYSRASNLPTSLNTMIVGASTTVVFSQLSSELRNSGAFHETYLRFMRLLLGLLWPMMLGIAVLAQPLIAILYGAKWQAAATPLALLTIAAAITVAIGLTTEIFILRHQTARQLRIEVVRAVVGYASFALGALISLTVAAAARVLEAVLAFILYRKPMSELVGGAPGDLRKVYVEGLLVTLAAVLPAFLLMLWFEWSPATPIIAIGAAIGLGVVCWGLLLVQLRHPLYLEGMRLVTRRP